MSRPFRMVLVLLSLVVTVCYTVLVNLDSDVAQAIALGYISAVLTLFAIEAREKR